MIKTLSNDEIAYLAPSVAAVEHKAGLSSRYEMFPTMQVVDQLRANGWMPTKAQQSYSRDYNNKPFAKHLVSFTHRRSLESSLASSLPQILVVNSHNGTTAYKVQAGIFRLVCSNGLVVMSTEMASVSIRHSGRDNTMEAILNATKDIANGLPQVGETVKRMEATILPESVQLEFAANAAGLRWGSEVPNGGIDLQGQNRIAEKLLANRRIEDKGSSLWKTFNRVQENLVKGGTRLAFTETGRRNSTRAVTGVDSSLTLNAGLWSLAESYLN